MENKLKLFDNEFKQINSYEMLGFNFIKYILTFIGAGLMFIPPFDSKIAFIQLELLGACVIMHINKHLYTNQERKRISIYSVLAPAGLSKKFYVKARTKYLNSYLIKIMAASAVMQFIGTSLEGFTATELAYSAFYIIAAYVVLFFVGYADILASTKI